MNTEVLLHAGCLMFLYIGLLWLLGPLCVCFLGGCGCVIVNEVDNLGNRVGKGQYKNCHTLNSPQM